MTDPRAILKAALAQRGIDWKQASKKIGRNAAYVQQFITLGKPKELAEEDRLRLADVAGINETQLRGRRGAPSRTASRRPPRESAEPEIVTVRGMEFAAINRWDIRASAGPGALVAGEPEILHPTLFRLDWLRSLTRSPLEKLAVIQVQGDSLEPTLRNGDTVLIDMQQNRPARLDGIYAIQRDDDMQVKRLSVHPETGRLTIGSDNPAYPTYTNVDPEHVIVVGRVIWVGRRT